MFQSALINPRDAQTPERKNAQTPLLFLKEKKRGEFNGEGGEMSMLGCGLEEGRWVRLGLKYNRTRVSVVVSLTHTHTDTISGCCETFWRVVLPALFWR